MFDEKEFIAKMNKSRKEFERRSKELVSVRMKLALEGFTCDVDRFEIAPELILRKAELEERQAFYSRTNNPKDIDGKANENEYFADYDFKITRGSINGLAPGDGITLVSIFFAISSKDILNIVRGNFYLLFGEEFRSAGFYTTPNEYRFASKVQFTREDLYRLKLIWPYFKKQYETNFSFALVARRYFYSQLRLSREDRIIDLMIALEALLVPERSGTKGDKISTRLAQLIHPEYNPLEVQMLTEVAYRLRNKIIHGGKIRSIHVDEFDIDLMSKYCQSAIRKYLTHYRGLSSKALVNAIQSSPTENRGTCATTLG